jgi:NitT/TauT family transport system permease protein
VNFVLPPILATIGVVFAWHVAVTLGDVSPVILPTPMRVLTQLVGDVREIARNALLTLAEAAGGFVLATLVGILGAVVFVLFPRLADAFYPLVVAVKMIPLIALAPLIVVWFGTGFGSKVVMAAIVAFFPILVNALRGLRGVGRELEDLFATLSAGDLQVLWKLRLPSAIGYTFAALRVAAVFAVIGAVVAEFIGANAGIGYYVKAASYYAATDRMLAGIIATGLVGAILYGAVILLERASPRWRQAAEGAVPI